jgi:hypothetical protein
MTALVLATVVAVVGSLERTADSEDSEGTVDSDETVRSEHEAQTKITKQKKNAEMLLISFIKPSLRVFSRHFIIEQERVL